MAEKLALTIAKERVEDLASRNAEPTWLKESRLLAWENYFKLPLPNPREEHWHKTSIAKLDLSQYTPLEANCKTSKALTFALVENYLKGLAPKAASILVQGWGSQETYFELTEEAKAKGVIFKPLSQALLEEQSLLESIICHQTTSGSIATQEKFSQLNQALFQGGGFLYIPANTTIDEPFIFALNLPQPVGKQAVFPRLLVVLGNNSRAKLVTIAGGDQYAIQAEANGEAENALFVDQLTQITLAPGARLDAVNVDSLSGSTYYLSKLTTKLERDAHLELITCGLGAKQIKSDLETIMAGEGSYSKIQGIVLGGGDEQFSYNTIQEHACANAGSDIIFRVALKDRAQSIYQGNVKVDKCAQKTNAFQSNKNLLLGKDAKADSIPRLEILADDVKCSHGATVGPVDPEQLFYLMSRGLSLPEAEEFIVMGFFGQVLDTLNIAGTTEWIAELVAKKIHTES
jgi:Fe-S cluster assembly protein SufD